MAKIWLPSLVSDWVFACLRCYLRVARPGLPPAIPLSWRDVTLQLRWPKCLPSEKAEILRCEEKSYSRQHKAATKYQHAPITQFCPIGTQPSDLYATLRYGHLSYMGHRDAMHSLVKPNAWVVLRLPSDSLKVVQIVPNT